MLKDIQRLLFMLLKWVHRQYLYVPLLFFYMRFFFSQEIFYSRTTFTSFYFSIIFVISYFYRIFICSYFSFSPVLLITINHYLLFLISVPFPLLLPLPLLNLVYIVTFLHSFLPIFSLFWIRFLKMFKINLIYFQKSSPLVEEELQRTTDSHSLLLFSYVLEQFLRQQVVK